MTPEEKIKQMEKEIEAREEGCLWNDTFNVDLLVNEFIKTWTTCQSHLLDNDENDGQRLRNNLELEIVKAKLQAYKQGLFDGKEEVLEKFSKSVIEKFERKVENFKLLRHNAFYNDGDFLIIKELKKVMEEELKQQLGDKK